MQDPDTSHLKTAAVLETAKKVQEEIDKAIVMVNQFWLDFLDVYEDDESISPPAAVLLPMLFTKCLEIHMGPDLYKRAKRDAEDAYEGLTFTPIAKPKEGPSGAKKQ